MEQTLLARAGAHLLATLKRGFDAWLFVTKLSVPAMILTRLLMYFDLIPYVAAVFKPIMALLNLPPETALVWVSAIVANLYVPVTVFIGLMPVMDPLSLSQATTLGALCLLCHGLFIEGQVCRATGLSFWRVSVFRLVSAVAFGLIISRSAALIGWGAGPSAVMPALQAATDLVPSWGDWIFNSVRQLLMILVLVEALMLFMELVKHLKLTRLISKVLGPPLRWAGVGENAMMVTVIGCVLGLALGGGLIVAESRSGHISPRDIFGAMMLMAVFHSMVEDTFLMWALGGSLFWLLGARLVFALAVASAVNRLARKPAWRPLLVGDKLQF